MNRKSLGFVFLILIIGAIIGTALGELIAYLLPEGVVEQFFLKSATIGFEPFTVNLGIISFTLGFKFILNVIGIVGIAFAAYMLRWYHRERF
jgi:hypothetical protein